MATKAEIEAKKAFLKNFLEKGEGYAKKETKNTDGSINKALTVSRLPGSATQPAIITMEVNSIIRPKKNGLKFASVESLDEWIKLLGDPKLRENVKLCQEVNGTVKVEEAAYEL